MVQPIASEVNAVDRRIGGDDDFLARGNLQHRRVVANSLRGVSPLCEQHPQKVEFLSGTELQIPFLGVPGVVHLSAGSCVITGSTGSASGSFQARGKEYKTSSR